MLPTQTDLEIMKILDDWQCTSLNLSFVKETGQYRATAMRVRGDGWDVGFGLTPTAALKEMRNASAANT